MADFTGTSGDDHITGTDSADFIDVSQGGNDTVHAAGGDDVVFIGAALARGDYIDGGAGYDVLKLDGDYSHGVKQLGLVFSNIEEVDLAAGNDYHLVFGNGNVAPGATMTVDASALGAGDALYLDAHKVKDGAVTLMGGAGDDTLIGAYRGAALNVLSGGGGNDTIYSDGTDFGNTNGIGGPHTIDGGTGNDTIYCADGDSVQGGDGNDTIRFDLYFDGRNGQLGTVDGGDGDDHVFLFSGDVTAGKLQGGVGVDTLSVENGLHLDMPEFSAATSGFESLELGLDAFIYGDAEDNNLDFSGFTIPGGGGVRVIADDGDDIVVGSSGNDLLDGVDGNDTLTGGLGRDLLRGGAGLDIFVYESTADSSPNAKQYDTIKDFHHDEGDLLDLSGIDADTTQGGDQAFHLSGSTFTDTPGELIQFVDAEGHTILQGDVNGDGVADLEIRLNHAPVLVSGDFVL